MPEPAEQAAETVPRKKRWSWLRFSLRSLMILLTLSCVFLGGKLKYDRYKKKWLVAEWVAPLVKEAKEPTGQVNRRARAANLPAAPKGVKFKDEVEFLTFGILELDTPEERFSAPKNTG